MDDYDSEMEESDRLSELPNSLIHLILSLLPIREVVSTTILSKRWKNLWTTVNCLNFCNLTTECNESEPQIERVRNFVNRALIFWRGFWVLKYKLDIHWSLDSSIASDVDLWVRFAVENNVKELNLRLMCEGLEILDLEESKMYAYRTPPCLNSCLSIKKLSLVGCRLRVPVLPTWFQLKSLKIDGFSFSERLINRVLLGSPRLEVFELRLLESDENLNIRSTSLKKLKIEKYLISGYDEPSADTMVRIHCPNLEKLDLLGALYSNYSFAYASSVTDVTFAFDGLYDYVCGNELLEETLEQIFSTFQHVDRVTLSPWCVQVLGALQEKNFLRSATFFPNVVMLVIEDKSQCEPEFDGTQHMGFESKVSQSFMLQLKTIDIASSLHNTSTFRFIELLKNAIVLEKLVIRVKMLISTDWFKVAARLLCLPRSSPTAKVILIEY